MYDLKDPWTMLDAAARLLQIRPATKVVFVGDGPLRLLLKEGARSRGIAAQTLFTGARSDIGSILKASDVFVSLNLADNCWATTIAEAMHLGVPCVVSKGATDGPQGVEARPIPLDVLDETGEIRVPARLPHAIGARGTTREERLFPHGEAAWLVPQRDPDTLALAIDRILGDRELAGRLAEGGRALLEGHRRRDDLILDDTLKLYESVTDGH